MGSFPATCNDPIICRLSPVHHTPNDGDDNEDVVEAKGLISETTARTCSTLFGTFLSLHCTSTQNFTKPRFLKNVNARRQVGLSHNDMNSVRHLQP